MKRSTDAFVRSPILLAAFCSFPLLGCLDRKLSEPGEGQRQAIERAPEPMPPDQAASAVGSPVRAGATRVRVRATRSFFVAYSPRKDLSLVKFEQAVQGKPFAFEATPLEQNTSRAIEDSRQSPSAHRADSHPGILRGGFSRSSVPGARSRMPVTPSRG